MSSLFPNVEKYSEDSLFVELKNEFDTNKKMVRNQKFIDNMMKKGFLKYVFFPFNLFMAFLTAQSKLMKIVKCVFLAIIALFFLSQKDEPLWFFTITMLMFMCYFIFGPFLFGVLFNLKKNDYLRDDNEFKTFIHEKFLKKTLTKTQMEKFKKELNSEFRFTSAMNEKCEISYVAAMKELHEKYERDHEQPKTQKELDKELKKKELEKMKSSIYQKL